MGSVTLEAELVLAPVKVQATFRAVAAGIAEFTRVYGREPGIRSVSRTILANLIVIGADRSDVQWLVDAEFMPVEFLPEWEAASRGHA